MLKASPRGMERNGTPEKEGYPPPRVQPEGRHKDVTAGRKYKKFFQRTKAGSTLKFGSGDLEINLDA